MRTPFPCTRVHKGKKAPLEVDLEPLHPRKIEQNPPSVVP
jgi:hypothetical protein